MKQILELIKLVSLTIFMAVISNVAIAGTSDITDDAYMVSAISYIMKDDLANAMNSAQKSNDPAYAKAVIEVLKLYNAPSAIPPSKALTLLSNYSWIPSEIFLSKIEASINHTTAPEEVKLWFSHRKPGNNRGKFLSMHAAIKLKEINIANKEVASKFRELWRSTELNMAMEEYIISEYKSIFTIDDLLRKIDLLIWNQSLISAQKFVDLLPASYQGTFKIKLDVAKNPKLARKYINYPVTKKDEFIKYLYIKDELVDKIKLDTLKFLINHRSHTNCKKWWKLKNLAFREAITNKNYDIAYSLIQNHYMKSGSEFADATWYAGWVALEFLKKPDKAIWHFLSMYEGVKLSNSKSKAAYWLACSYKASKNLAKTKLWYQKAASYPSTFYGQLALAEIKGNSKYNYFDSYKENTKITSTNADKDKIKKITLLSYYLFKANYKLLAYNILEHIPALKLDRIELEAAAFFFNKRNLNPLAVELGKSSANRSFIIIKEAYPTHIKITNTALPKALYLSIIRQESNFDTNATSSAGAIGLMQLMPATATKLAYTLNLAQDAYIYDPDANVKKGATYLDQLYLKYNNIILTITAYNAGPGNVNKWLTLIGDPRQMTLNEKINWIESIPFAETRNYVKKILENMVIYDSMLNSHHNARSIIKFLEL